jgi:hypothetical protein
VINSPASYALAEEFTVIPFPFAGKARQELEAEYSLLLSSEISPKEISNMILYALEVLLNKRKKAKNQKDFDKATFQISDMLGRLLVFEELLYGSKK